MYFDEEFLACGTAFIVRRNGDYFLITNLHNVTGRDPETNKPKHSKSAIPNKIKVFYNLKNSLGSYFEYTHDLFKNDGITKNWHEHPCLNRVDVVAISVPKIEKISLDYFYEIDASSSNLDLKPTDLLSVIGFPFGKKSMRNFAIWVTGSIASDFEIDYSDLPIFLIDCRTRTGQSGSPVILYRNSGIIPFKSGSTLQAGIYREFLGVYSGRISEESDIAMVWKKQVLSEIIDSF